MVKFVRRKVTGIGITIGVLLLAIFAAKRFNLGGQIIEGFKGAGGTVGEIILAPIVGIAESISAGQAELSAKAGQAGLDVLATLEDFSKFLFSTLGPGTEFDQKQGTFIQTTTVPQPTGGSQVTIPTASGFSLSELLNTIERNPQEFVGGVAPQDVESGNVFKSLTELLQQSGVTADPLFTGVQPLDRVLDLKSIIADASSRITASIARTTAPETSTSTPFGGFASAVEQEAGLQATLARNALLFPQFFQ